ncbi:Oxidoreductase family protein [Tenacibaculum sp. 190524A02b]|uniref:Oxidoreductase family protein n=1 Tax=Tenacibaculum vairaonense TaxID=3137860 RepID=A0ABP1F8A5_9FLAO
MEVIFQDKVYDGFLEPFESENEISLSTIHMVVVKKNGSGFINYEGGLKSRIRVLFNYAFVYGLSDLYHKIKSRNSEKIRNDKYLVFGIGIDKNKKNYFFINPSSQYFQSVSVVPKSLCVELSGADYLGEEKTLIDIQDDGRFSDKLDFISNFSLYSGFSLEEEYIPPLLNEGSKIMESILKEKENLYEKIYKKETVKHENTELTEERKIIGKSAVLFGYGNYAKTILIPNISKYLTIHRVHEIDPVQLYNCSIIEKSTSPIMDFSYKFDVWLIAGFHHTHVNLAIECLKSNSIPVIEKPLSTNREQFDQFKKGISIYNKIPFYICFQKRYMNFNSYVYEDFKITKGAPINYKAIVFEIPLDEGHWYNWPNSGSRIISNGCHWIDHFMYLNDYSKYISHEAIRVDKETINCIISLENGASAIITITDSGSKRLGVREYIELTVDGARAVIIDSSFYKSENNNKVIRTKRENKLEALKTMYSSIAKDIKEEGKGDSLKSLISSELSIALNEKLEKKSLKNN